jgi:hypothetical protein
MTLLLLFIGFGSTSVIATVWFYFDTKAGLKKYPNFYSDYHNTTKK